MKKLIINYLLIAITILFGFSSELTAQIQEGGIPFGLLQKNKSEFRTEICPMNKLVDVRLKRLTVKEINQLENLGKSQTTASETRFKSEQFAVKKEVDCSLFNSGQIFHLSNGMSLWQLKINAIGATSLNFYFDKFRLPTRAKLYIYNPTTHQVLGAYTVANNSKWNDLAVRPIQGGDCIVELSWPTQGEKPDLHLSEIYQGYRQLPFYDSGLRFSKPNEPWNTAGYPCAPFVSATAPVWQRRAHSVVLCISGGTVFSGALINNLRSDGTSYVLSSSHCFNNNFVKKYASSYTARRTVYFFNFQSYSPFVQIRGVESQSISGSILVGINDDVSDMAIVKLTGLPVDSKTGKGYLPASYCPYYAGWNISLKPKGPYVGIHHPRASVKRYSMTDSVRLQDYKISNTIRWEGAHWFIKSWKVGTTDGGSSGSPLFDNEGSIIGALTGGASTCEIPNADAYWAISKVWDLPGNQKSLKPILDPDNTGATQCKPYVPYNFQRLSNAYPIAREGRSFPEGFVSAQYNEMGTSYTITPQDSLLGVYIFLPSFSETKPMPSYKLNLYSMSSGLPSELILSKSISIPSYQRFDYQGDPVNTPQTVSSPFEIFVDLSADQAALLSHRNGNPIFVSLSLASDQADQPFYAITVKDENAVAPATMVKSPGGVWQVYSGITPWIDLLVMDTKTSVAALASIATNTKVKIRGSKEGIRLTLPSHLEGTKMQLIIYSLDGRLCQSTSITNSGIVRLSYQIQGKIATPYVVVLRTKEGQVISTAKLNI